MNGGGGSPNHHPKLTNHPVEVRADAVRVLEEENHKCLWPSTAGNLSDAVFELTAHLPFSWIAVPGENGIHVLLLSRDHEKAIQRRAYFSFSGVEEISVHRKPLTGPIYEDIVSHMQLKIAPGMDLEKCSPFVQRVLTIVQRLRTYEVCVGVNDPKFKALWAIDKGGEVDKNPFGELRYKETFRPFKCNLLVSSASYLKKRCAVCAKTANRFRAKLKRHISDTASSNTPNIHLDRAQLLNKVTMQQKKVKVSQAKVARMRLEIEQALSKSGYIENENVCNDLMNICMAYTSFEL